MFKKLRLLLFFPLLSTGACFRNAVYRERSLMNWNFRQTPPRTVTICLLNDAVSPVRDMNRVYRILREVSGQFEREAGIRFVIQEEHIYEDLFRYTPNIGEDYGRIQAYAIRLVCSTRSDIVIAISNMNYPLYGGMAFFDQSFAIIFNFEFEASQDSTYSAHYGHAATVMKHEFGHLLGSPHLYDTRLFMHPLASVRLDAWSIEERRLFSLLARITPLRGWQRSPQ